MSTSKYNTRIFHVEVENEEKDTMTDFQVEAVDFRAAIASMKPPTNADEVVRIYGQAYTATITQDRVILTDNMTAQGFVYLEYTDFERGERKNYIGNDDGISLFDLNKQNT